MKDILLEDLRANINSLLGYIEYLNFAKTQENVIEKYLKQTDVQNRIKIFEYKSLIVSIYGILENTISKLIVAYVAELKSAIPNYKQFPEKLIKQNTINTIKTLNKIIDYRNTKYDELSKQNLINNLSLCFQSPKKYIINSETFTPDSGNLKFNKIEEAFSEINTNLCKELLKLKRIEVYFNDHFGTCNQLSLRRHFAENIDDLVTRRNDIAHGNPVDEILDISLIQELLNVVAILLEGVFEVLSSRYYSYATKYNYIKADEVLDVFKQGSIVGIRIHAGKLKLNDWIVVEKSSGLFIRKKIYGIEINRNAIPEINNINESTVITLNLESGLSKKDNIYIKKDI